MRAVTARPRNIGAELRRSTRSEISQGEVFFPGSRVPQNGQKQMVGPYWRLLANGLPGAADSRSASRHPSPSCNKKPLALASRNGRQVHPRGVSADDINDSLRVVKACGPSSRFG